MFTTAAALLAATLLSASGPAQYAMPGFNCIHFDEKSCTFFAEYLAERLQEGGGVEITTQAEIAAVLGLERQKQMLGCAEDEASCLVELAGALGSDALVLGSLARVGADLVVSAKIVQSRDARTSASATRRVKSETELLDALSSLAVELRQKAGFQQAPQAALAPVAPVEAGRPFGWVKWTAAGVGVAAAAGGGLLMGQAHNVRNALHATPNRTAAQLEELVDEGRLYQNVGMPLLIGGAVALAAAGGLFLWEGAGTTSAGLSVSPGGVALSFGGTFP